MNHSPIGRRALYNSLRWHWVNNPELQVYDWQVEDYELLSDETLFLRLSQLGIVLDRHHFVAFAENFDDPEDLTESLLDDLPQIEKDKIFLCIFELWKRFISRKKPISVFFDTLDRQIEIYDQEGSSIDMPQMANLLFDFKELLDLNMYEHGNSEQEIFTMLIRHSAHDLEMFLYDYIVDQIELGHCVYAKELLDDFIPFIADKKWFLLLRLKLSSKENFSLEDRLYKQLVEESPDSSLEFVLELLAICDIESDMDCFITLLHRAKTLIHTEEEFSDLLSTIEDVIPQGASYYRDWKKLLKRLSLRTQVVKAYNSRYAELIEFFSTYSCLVSPAR